MHPTVLEDLDPRVLGARLQEIRRARGLTQQAVAEEMGMARTTVVAVEKGERRLNERELVQFARLYGAKVSDIVGRKDSPDGFTVLFRSLYRKTDKPAEDSALNLEQMQIAEDLEKLARNYRELERLCNVRSTPLNDRKYVMDGISPEQAAEEIAVAERYRLHLDDGPIYDLAELLETEVGIRIFCFPMPSNISGCFAFVDDLGACIGINSKHPRERQNWTLAHEYGHFLVNRHEAGMTFLKGRVRTAAEERFVDAFVAHFLMPASGVNRRFSDLQRQSASGVTLAQICTMADHFRVSVQAIILRLEDLRRIPSGTWDNLVAKGFKPRKAQAALGIESTAAMRERFPQRYIEMAITAYEKEELSEGELVQYLRTDRTRARLLVDEFKSRSAVGDEGLLNGEVDLARSITAR